MNATLLHAHFTTPIGRGRLDARKRDSRVRGYEVRRALIPLTLTLSPSWRSHASHGPGRGDLLQSWRSV
jgi:hypothetical protein